MLRGGISNRITIIFDKKSLIKIINNKFKVDG